MEETRDVLEARRKDSADPTLMVGDVVFCCGKYAEVTEIVRHTPDTHPASPIRNDYTAVQVRTEIGASRWHGIAPKGDS